MGHTARRVFRSPHHEPGWNWNDDNQGFGRGPGARSAAGLRAAAEHGSQWAAIESVASTLGCRAETLRRWVRQAEKDAGQRAGLTTSERGR